jgi:predicted AlkP superfamily phosphohydrolase/phosphomutase
MREGKLPGLSRLVSEGAWGELTSTIPPLTPAALSSLITGKNPGKHGIYDFFVKNDKSIDGTPIQANARDGKAVWDLISERGKKATVINIPTTYPPKPLNGMLISGFLTPMGRTDFTYPKGLLKEIEGRFGPYRLHFKENYQSGKIKNLLDELFGDLKYKGKVVRYLMHAYEWDFFLVYLSGTDRIQHELWHILDPGHPRHRKDERAKHYAEIVRYFQVIESEIIQWMELSGEASTIVFSDHGFGPLNKFISFNVWLLEKGFLTLKSSALARIKKALFDVGLTPVNAYKLASQVGLRNLRSTMDLSKRSKLQPLINSVFLSFSDIDWTRTRAYSKGNYGQIYLNVKGREPYGTVSPGDDERRITEEIVGHLHEIRDPATGQRIPGRAYRKEELYSGKYLKWAPDIIFLPEDMSYRALGSLDFPSNRFIQENYGLSGDHRMNGILICSGPPFRKGHMIRGARLLDLTPTLLYLMGMEINSDMDGSVLTDLFTSDFLDTHGIRYTDRRSDTGTAETPDLSDNEIDEIRKRLKGLGYLGS